MFFCRGVDQPNIQNVFLVRICESLIREGQGAKDYKKKSKPNNRFHRIHLQATFRSMGLEPTRQQEPRRHLTSLNVGLG